ncbi:MAG: hypothetical protein KJO12_02195 [Ignavibacteria bacterium]|nr:hypothetical protein [Ignavibacteria bacterium]
MNYSEVHLKNPINSKSITELFGDIKDCNSTHLIINIGAHNFESIEVIKELKNKLIQAELTMKRFKKIAIIHPPEFRNKSEDEERYNYFSNNNEAVNWLEKL